MWKFLSSLLQMFGFVDRPIPSRRLRERRRWSLEGRVSKLFSMEMLEDRVLLSGTSGEQQEPLIIGSVSIQQASISLSATGQATLKIEAGFLPNNGTNVNEFEISAQVAIVAIPEGYGIPRQLSAVALTFQPGQATSTVVVPISPGQVVSGASETIRAVITGIDAHNVIQMGPVLPGSFLVGGVAGSPGSLANSNVVVGVRVVGQFASIRVTVESCV